MARFKPYDYKQRVMIPVALDEQIMEGTLEYAITHYAGMSERVSVIVTRNTKDCSKGEVSAVLPEIFNAPPENSITSKLHGK